MRESQRWHDHLEFVVRDQDGEVVLYDQREVVVAGVMEGWYGLVLQILRPLSFFGIRSSRNSINIKEATYARSVERGPKFACGAS